MSALKNIQYFIHKHYEVIKLGLLSIIIFIGVLTLISISASDARRADYEAKQDALRSRQLAQQNAEISRTQKEQHDAQDRRMACFFNLFVDYTNHRKPITEEDVNRCEITPSAEAEPFVQSAPRVPTPTPSTPVPDAPGKSDGKRNN